MGHSLQEWVETGQDKPIKAKRGRPKATVDESLRQQIVTQATEAFLDVGYAGTTMDIVAARCRISKRTLYRLFPGKTDLFRAIIHSHRQSMLDLPRQDDDVPVDEALHAIFGIDMDEAQDRRRVAFVRLVIAEVARFPELGDLIQVEGGQASQHLLADWLAAQAQRGRIRIPDPLQAARMLMDMVFGVFVPRLAIREVKDGPERRAYIRMCIDVFVNGVRRG